jgi:uncharacterized protein
MRPWQTQLLQLAESQQSRADPSHDFQHVRRVLHLAEQIAGEVMADPEIIVPAALLHDTVIYAKNDPRSIGETEESAQRARELLARLTDYPQQKISSVCNCIRECSYSKRIPPSSIESAVLQDADRLEATGAIAIMRTFSSGGMMNIPFYDPSDPFCERGSTQFSSGIDLFQRRLLKVESSMNTEPGKTLARRRTLFLRQFLAELRLELIECGICAAG